MHTTNMTGVLQLATTMVISNCLIWETCLFDGKLISRMGYVVFGIFKKKILVISWLSTCNNYAVHLIHCTIWYTFTIFFSKVCGLEFDRKDISMNKLVATSLEAKFHCFDMRTQHPTKGFASVSEKVCFKNKFYSNSKVLNVKSIKISIDILSLFLSHCCNFHNFKFLTSGTQINHSLGSPTSTPEQGCFHDFGRKWLIISLEVVSNTASWCFSNYHRMLFREITLNLIDYRTLLMIF